LEIQIEHNQSPGWRIYFSKTKIKPLLKLIV